MIEGLVKPKTHYLQDLPPRIGLESPLAVRLLMTERSAQPPAEAELET